MQSSNVSTDMSSSMTCVVSYLQLAISRLGKTFTNRTRPLHVYLNNAVDKWKVLVQSPRLRFSTNWKQEGYINPDMTIMLGEKN